MKKPATPICSLTAALVTAAMTLPVAAQYVTVGDPGNSHDPATGGLYGGVGYTYAISTYEVTLDQYTTFLNAVAATDTFNLYNSAMATNLNSAGINRAGSPGSYTYSVIGSGARPVTYVSFYDAMRYANWLGTGNTETGAYTLLGGTAVPTNGLTVTRNGGATFFLPSENEWYKAAYYQPTAQGGDSDDYWQYPTGSNAIPNSRNGSVSDPNSANFSRNDGTPNGYNGGFAVTNSPSTVGTQNYLTEVGAFTQADSYYGTFDQGGNVAEWNETIIGSTRGVRGGSWGLGDSFLRASGRDFGLPTEEGSTVGFRVATVPEPTAGVSLMLAGGLLLARRKRPGTR
ncbi:MAG: SUMF1/EgtB/PvdO family nonheme iron enzyme [Chthoniobacter sp.]|nr:SUMF1/EgtB/PvdO family nonheme iron enzyme [Chthoniobacter sp.]